MSELVAIVITVIMVVPLAWNWDDTQRKLRKLEKRIEELERRGK